MGFRQERIQDDRLAAGGNGVVHLAQFQQRRPQDRRRRGVAGVEANGAAYGIHRLGKGPLAQEGRPEIGVRIKKMRGDTKRLLELVFGFGQSAEVEQQPAEIIVPFPEIRLQSQSGLEQLDRRLMPPGGMVNHPEKVERLMIAGIASQCRMAGLFSPALITTPIK